MIRTLAALRRLLPFPWLLFIFVASAAGVKPPEVGVPAEGKSDPPITVSQDTAIPRETLIGMYRTELGERFHVEDADKLLAAHQWIERYFDAAGAADRKQAVRGLEMCGLDAGVIGRIVRLRMRWPALEGGVYYVNEKRGPLEVRYFLGVPAGYDRTKPWPLVVKLAPVNPFLVQPPPDADAVVKIYNDWIRDELTRHSDALVLMPLLNLDELYGPSYAGMNNVMQPLFHAADRVNIDPARVYLIGHSTGGHATWNLALQYPTYFAAIAPLAGGASQDWQRLRLVNLRNVLPVVWADAKDDVVKPESSRSIVAVMRNLKLAVDYVETKNFGHAPPEMVADERYKTMRARVRDLYPAWVTIQSNRPDVIFNRNDWIQIWQETDPGKESRMIFRHGGGHMVVTRNSARIDARYEGNSIDLTLDNVESLRIYLNDRMVDFDKPIKVHLNKKRTIEGYAHRNIEQMMNDQIFLGRGWRYYSAVLDIDLTDPSAATRPSTNPSTRATTRPSRTGKIIIGPS
ncbi:MAG TPA: hypothetical protein VG326_21050 [Tepidisphaeraceae bacterium]|jgi:hypothetical protein|nr:hypothetical protein [Tepidisphaeraceae bacterium]